MSPRGTSFFLPQFSASLFMRFIHSSIFVILCITAFDSHLNGVLVDDRADRVKAGRKFLNKSRIDRWEKYFSEGLPKFGKIVLQVDGEPVKESWFEKDFMLIKDYRPENSFVSFSNPDYSAMIELNQGKYTLSSVGISLRWPMLDGRANL